MPRLKYIAVIDFAIQYMNVAPGSAGQLFVMSNHDNGGARLIDLVQKVQHLARHH